MSKRCSYCGWSHPKETVGCPMERVHERLTALEGKQEATAPEPASESLYVAISDDDTNCDDIRPATPAQVRAEAVRLGLLDTPRQKVAEAFLHAALASDFGGDESEDGAGAESERLVLMAKDLYVRGWKATEIQRMAAVLTQAAKGEGNG
jgi:hypothetical protein